ncbi:MAG: hypothetical protein CL489_07010 [Acidobacteria bacterium]|nr:hypothetical protein [Acidobacteriota bacterium]
MTQQLHVGGPRRHEAVRELMTTFATRAGCLYSGMEGGPLPPCVVWTGWGFQCRVMWLGVEPMTQDDRWLIDMGQCKYGHYPTLEDALYAAQRYAKGETK